MLSAVLTLGIAGLVFGGFLALAAQRFKVEEIPEWLKSLRRYPEPTAGRAVSPDARVWLRR